MDLPDLLDRMFPGCAERGFPPYSALDLSLDLLADHAPGMTALLQQNLADCEPMDVNLILKQLRKVAPDVVAGFCASALEAYFSAGPVRQILHPGPDTLFPHHRPVEEMDMDLLEPVWARAAPRDEA